MTQSRPLPAVRLLLCALSGVSLGMALVSAQMARRDRARLVRARINGGALIAARLQLQMSRIRAIQSAVALAAFLVAMRRPGRNGAPYAAAAIALELLFHVAVIRAREDARLADLAAAIRHPPVSGSGT